MKIELFSFGFKHALPDADTVIDVRFLPNPYYVPELSSKTGLNKAVSSYVLNNTAAEIFLTTFIPFLSSFIQSHADAERQMLRLAVGCTGGKHRSVAVAEKIKTLIEKQGVAVEIFHRDIEKN